MRLHFLLPTLAVSTLAALVNTAAALAPRERPAAVEGGFGVGTQVPGWGDQGLGPFLSATLRVGDGRAGRAFLLGVGYGIVFTDGWTSPDGDQYDFAPEAVLLHLGHEWAVDEQRRFAFDGQWNPAGGRSSG